MREIKITLLILIISVNSYAQQIKVTQDFGAWIGFSLKKKKGNYQLELEQQLRTYKSALKVDDYLVDLGCKYAINKSFSLNANLRYIYDRKRWKEPENNLRYNFDLGYKVKIIEDLDLTYRARYQKELVNPFNEELDQNEHFSGFRNKIKLKYKYDDRNKVYVSAELFRLIQPYRAPYFNKLQFLIGDKLNTNIGKFDCSLGFEKEIQSSHPYSFGFLKIRYTLRV